MLPQRVEGFHVGGVAAGQQGQQPTHKPLEPLAAMRFGSVDFRPVFPPKLLPPLAAAEGVQGVAFKGSLGC